MANGSSTYILSGRANYSFVVNGTNYLNSNGPGFLVFCTGIWVENDTSSYVRWTSATGSGSDSGTVAAFNINSNAYYGGNGNQMSWNEIIIWDSALSSTDYDAIDQNLQTYFGI